MHYYKFNIADWILHTSHLTPEEEGIYLRLLNHYYDTESSIPTETQPVIRRLRLIGLEDKALMILEEFFYQEGGFWNHKRCQKEILAYQTKAETSKANGSKGGRPRGSTSSQKNPKKPRKTQAVNSGNPEITLTKNQEPITKNQISPPNPPEGACSAGEKNISVIDQINQTTQNIVNQSSSSPLPDNFELRTETLEALLELHKIPDKFVIEQWSEFVIYWRDHRGGRISWDSTFFKRCIHQWKLHGPQWLKLEKGNDDGTSQDRGNRENGWDGTDWADGVDLTELYQPDGQRVGQQVIPESSGDLPSVEASV